MAANVVGRIGQVNQSGGVEASFLKVFGGEVINTFDELNVISPHVVMRNISSGKTAQFPVTGVAAAAYHVPGAQLLGQNTMMHSEKTIGIDGVLLSHESIAEIDEKMSHWETRSEYARKMGAALAIKSDQQQLQVMLLAARASATLTGGNGGTALTDADAATNAASLAATAYTCSQTFDEADVPEDGRVLCVRPAQYYLLAQETGLIDTDFSAANGDYSKAQIKMVGGLQIIKSNHIPSTTLSAETGVSATNTYHGVFGTTVAVAFQKGAIGTVKLMDIAVESEWQISRQSTLLVTKMAVGHGILRPECAIEIKTA
tara:strand:+ start:14554 stop:15501 length:948 start_codon:yes stop_codon:yes gene_type:complete